jgi:hypothetical protein
MSKEQTLIEEATGLELVDEFFNSIQVFDSEERRMKAFYQMWKNDRNQLLTKEKEQREEEIKSVAVDAYIAGYEKGNKCSLRFSVGSAYEYYNEVIKGRN